MMEEINIWHSIVMIKNKTLIKDAFIEEEEIEE